jgi:hypothetical protein
MPLNILEWVTCLHCGINFQVAVPHDTYQIMASVSRRRSADDYFFTHCPKCKKKMNINIYYEE